MAPERTTPGYHDVTRHQVLALPQTGLRALSLAGTPKRRISFRAETLLSLQALHVWSHSASASRTAELDRQQPALVISFRGHCLVCEDSFCDGNYFDSMNLAPECALHTASDIANAARKLALSLTHSYS